MLTTTILLVKINNSRLFDITENNFKFQLKFLYFFFVDMLVKSPIFRPQKKNCEGFPLSSSIRAELLCSTGQPLVYRSLFVTTTTPCTKTMCRVQQLILVKARLIVIVHNYLKPFVVVGIGLYLFARPLIKIA